MKHNSLRQVLMLVVVSLSLVVIVLLAGGSQLTQVTAQEEEGELWATSAEAPPEFPLDRFSPADSPVTVSQEDAPNAIEAPDALVSWRVTGAFLKPRENDVSYTVNGNGSCTYVTAGDAFTVWNIAPALPQGAVVDTLRMYYYDTSGSNTTAWFTVYDLYGSIVQEWAVSSSGSGGNSFNDSAAINHTIDYSVYSYLINWRPSSTGSTLQLCGFRVFYEPPPFGVAFLPSIQKNP